MGQFYLEEHRWVCSEKQGKTTISRELCEEIMHLPTVSASLSLYIILGY